MSVYDELFDSKERNNMTREGTVDLLDDVEECLIAMKKTEQIKPVKIKSILENLRSALEYVANDTYDKYIPSNSIPRPKIYFPYGEQKRIDNFFIKKLQIRNPSSSPLYSVFNSIQEKFTGDNWLKMMCDLTNDAKHRNPIPLDENEEIKQVTVSADKFGLIKTDGRGDITFKNVSVYGKKLTDFTYKKGVLNVAGNGFPLNIEITKGKNIKFHGNEYEVIPFLELSLKRIRKFTEEAYGILETL